MKKTPSPEGPVCPACGTPMDPDTMQCSNSACPLLQEQGGGWEPTDPDEQHMQTLAEWLAEYDFAMEDVAEDDFEFDDPERRYTRGDFERRAGLL